MQRQTENKIILVTRQTRWMEMMARHGTPTHARYYLSSRKLSSAKYQSESDQFDRSFKEAFQGLSQLGRVHHLQREHLPNFIFGPDDIVVVLDEEKTQPFAIMVMGDDMRGGMEGGGIGAPTSGDFEAADPPPLAPGLTEPVAAPDPAHRHQLKLIRLD